MKVIFTTFSFFLIVLTCNAQTFQATVKSGSKPNSVIVAIKPSADFTNAKITTLYFSVAVPASVSPRPTLSILTNFVPTLSYTTSAVAGTQMIAGSPYYIYDFLSDGQTGTGTDRNYTSGVDNNMAELVFQNGPTSPASEILLVNLVDGGTSQNSSFYISNLGVDVTNTTAMFYGGTPVNSPLGYGGLQFTNLANVILPVKFLGFNVVKKNNDGLITWQIENESSITDRYEIERGLNGVDFKKVYTVFPKNNGSSTNSYDLTDANLTAQNASGGIFYYRIKQIDKDGKFVYTSIKSLRLTSKAIALSIFPNPVKNFATISIDIEKDTKGTITINDASGKQIQNIQLALFKGSNIKKINLTNLAAGSYILKVQTATETEIISVVKSN
jgi:hypothetical protein